MNNIFRLSKNEVSVLKQVYGGKQFVSEIRLPVSRAMKYRIVQGLIKDWWLSYVLTDMDSVLRKQLFVRNREFVVVGCREFYKNNIYTKVLGGKQI